MGQTKDINVGYIGWPANDSNLLTIIGLLKRQPSIKVRDNQTSPTGYTPDVVILGKEEYQRYLKNHEKAAKWEKEHQEPELIDTSGLGDFLSDGH